MRFPFRTAFALTTAAVTLACANANSTQPTPAAMTSSSQQSNGASSGSFQRQLSMMDACDGPSFNLIIGPGTCSRPHGVNFSEFIAELTADQEVGPWHFGPAQTDAFVGDTILATNKGGEVHTFTKVAAFGPGLVDLLNNLSGVPGQPIKECQNEQNFVLPGGTDKDSLDHAGVIKFECCIHPWMRATVLVKSH